MSARERHAALMLAKMLQAGVNLDSAVLFTFAWLDAIERWQVHMGDLDR